VTGVESMKKQILTYFGTIASPVHGTLTIRDFNTQLMAKMFQASDRESLAVALDELIAEGLLVERSQKTYGLTAQGVAAAGESKAAKAGDLASKR
jgi:predicted component of type VI protein secretion system